ncbi:MAG: GNAT family N-acetyltransferase [Betaproteobacteria bacterium]|nr:GNAT family N-acetyltransferase [Betaproteobacteria bacterium]
MRFSLETNRLRLRPFSLADAPFVIELLNDPGWLRFIGDRNVRTIADAEAYIESRIIAQQQRVGYSLLRVARKDTDEPVGMCGLVRRDGLDDADIGFALLARHAGKGYAHEAARAVMHETDVTHRIERVVAICDPDNRASIRLLEKLGFTFEKTVRLPKDDMDLKLFARARPTGDQ